MSAKIFYHIRVIILVILFETNKYLRRNPPEVRVTSGQKSCTKIIYVVLQTSVGLF